VRVLTPARVGSGNASCQTVALKAVKVKECATDVKQDCAGKSGAALMACMKTHLADASEPCKEVLARSAVGSAN
jgi:hypothetical protein